MLNSKWVPQVSQKHILQYRSLPCSLTWLSPAVITGSGSPARAQTSLTVTPQGELPFKEHTGAKRLTITKIGPTILAPPQKCSFPSLIINQSVWNSYVLLLFVVVKHRVTTKLTKSKTIPVHRERRTQYSVIAVHLRRGHDEIQMTQGWVFKVSRSDISQ